MRAFSSAKYTVPMGGHSYPMEKYRRIPHQLIEQGTLQPQQLVEPEPASLTDIQCVHDATYVRDFVAGRLERDAMLRIGLPWSPQLVRRAFAVIGGTMGAARAALNDGIGINLAGGTHHAFAAHGEGYCIFNDLVIAARRLRNDRILRRCLIVDLDVHQGNGTAALCQDSSDVFTFSIHGANNYPARKERSSFDLGLPDGTTDDVYLEMLGRALPGTLDRFVPDLILFQAGVDVLAEDRFGKLALSIEGLCTRDRMVCEFAQRHGIPLAVTLGGGYARDLDTVVAAHCQTVRVMADSNRSRREPEPLRRRQ